MSNPTPLFDFFEMVCEELSGVPSKVITGPKSQSEQDHSPLLAELRASLGKSTTVEAIAEAVERLRSHFNDRNAELPFAYDVTTGRFDALDPEFINFVEDMRAIRSIGTQSREFEVAVTERLRLRLTGSLHRVGHPRDRLRTMAEINDYLRTIGFQGRVLGGKEKDGGLDILWSLPLGPSHHRPIVSIQCKNGIFDMAEANHSKETGGRSLDQHRGLLKEIHVPCVVFNDYMTPQLFGHKAMNFVPLGITDLATPKVPPLTVMYC